MIFLSLYWWNGARVFYCFFISGL